MNFFKFHLGDYAAATAHLTFVEDAAYCRMLRIYYRDERPLPAEVRAVQRLIGARTEEEKQAVETLLPEFFRLADDGWHNKRCDEEIGKANAQAEANRKVAQAREERRRARIAAAGPDLFNDSLHDSSNDSFESREPSQTPDARHQTSSTTDDANGEIPQRPLSERARASARKVCKELARAGLDISTEDPHLKAALQERFTADEIIALSRTRKGSGKPMLYLLQTLRGMRADAEAREPAPAGVLIGQRSDEWNRLATERETLEGSIYDARHQHETLKSITAAECESRVQQARQRICEIDAAMKAQEVRA